MRLILVGILALPLACTQYGPTIIEETIAEELKQTAPNQTEPEQTPQEAEGIPELPPVPVLDDGTPLHPPLLPPGMKPDPNANDLVSLYRRNCQDCHGEHGAGTKKGVPNFVETPQPLNNDTEPMIQKVLKGHGGAPAVANKLKPRTVFHLIGFMRGRVGQMRAIVEVEQLNPATMIGNQPKPSTSTP